jgi:hypothetical protein
VARAREEEQELARGGGKSNGSRAAPDAARRAWRSLTRWGPTDGEPVRGVEVSDLGCGEWDRPPVGGGRGVARTVWRVTTAWWWWCVLSLLLSGCCCLTKEGGGVSEPVKKGREKE